MSVWDNTGKLVLPGTFDPLVTSGSGSAYLNTIRQTSDQTLAAGQTLPTLSGNTISLTQLGVAARLSPSNTAYTHKSATYDAWFNGSQEQTEGHLMIVPVISQAVKNKPGNVTIIAFAVFFIDQPYQNQSTNAIALGRFLGLTVPTGTGGGCVGTGAKTSPHLIR